MDALEYPPMARDSLARETGYAGYLTLSQEQAVQALAVRLRGAEPAQPMSAMARANWRLDWAHELGAAQGADSWTRFLCRWLRARDFDVDRSFAMLFDHVEWRLAEGVTRLAALPEDEVLGCPRAEVLAMAPYWVAGYDAHGRPYVFNQYANLNTTALLQLTTVERLVRHHIWIQEQLTKLVALKARETGCVVETWCTVLVDLTRRLGRCILLRLLRTSLVL